MENKGLILLGRIIKLHGYKGDVVIALEEEYSAEEIITEQVFIGIDGVPVPFFLSSSKRLSPETVLVSFDYYESDDKMLEFVGCNLFTDTPPSAVKHGFSIESLKGYSLYTVNGQLTGKIIRVDKLPMQTILVVMSPDDNELLIPYNEDWVADNNREDKKLVMDLPEGLVAVN